MRIRVLAGVVMVLAIVAPGARAAAQNGPAAWKPAPAAYGVHKTGNVPVVMSDGTVLRADVYRPADLSTGRPVSGQNFPVLLTQTPYNKNAGLTFPDNYLISRGYIEVVVDVRGRGASEGNFEASGPRETQDGVEMVNWSSKLAGSTGKVGLTGCSYLANNQLLTAEAIGPNSPLKAIFPQAAANSYYRDLAFVGGMPTGFATALGDAVLPTLGAAGPVADYTGNPGDTAQVEAQHAAYPLWLAGSEAAIQNGTPTAANYDNQFWDLRDPGNHLDRIVANGIPTFLSGGLYDLLQRGLTMNYAGLQNAFAHRPLYGPMVPGQTVSGKFQLLQGPWYHCDGDQTGPAGSSVDIEALQLRWYDRWLKDDHNGIDDTKTPLHLWEANASRWIDTDVWPVTDKATTYYLNGGPSSSNAVSTNDGTLSTAVPKDATAADPVIWDGASGPCSNTEPAIDAQMRCASDDRAMQTGPHSLTYTTNAGGKTLAGTIDASVYLTDTARDAELAATIDDVAPDGTSVPVTGGTMLGSFRALDPTRTWVDSNGLLVNPYHPYTAESIKPIASAEVARIDVEIFGTVWKFAPGHKLRLTLRTSAAPWAIPTALQTKNLVGGVYQVQRNSAHPSFVNLPLLDTSGFPSGCPICIPPGA